jgi:cellulose synthase/poly-beta-1,6-N-acetylglucosamine synthase-like glycosyltransferase
MLLGVAVACMAVLAYTYVGYPVLVVLLSRVFPMKAKSDASYRPHVSALIPVYNAERFVDDKVESLMACDYPADKLEVLVYSDGSDDGSDARVEELAARFPGRVRLLRGDKRSGKPTALNVMRQQARGEVLLLTDIRQPLSANAVSDLVARLADPEVGCASGNLVLRGATGAGFYWHYENAIRKAEARFRSMCGVTGPLYAIRRADLPDVPADTILDDMWIPMRLRLAGKRLVLCEQAIAWDQAFDDEREFGRKVRTLAGNYQLFARLPRLLFPFTNPIFFETFSHKLLRLLCPWVLAVLGVATVVAVATRAGAAPGGWGWADVLLAAEAAFALLALLGARAGKLGNVARTFVVLNWAAVVGLGRFVRGAQRITW